VFGDLCLQHTAHTARSVTGLNYMDSAATYMKQGNFYINLSVHIANDTDFGLLG